MGNSIIVQNPFQNQNPFQFVTTFMFRTRKLKQINVFFQELVQHTGAAAEPPRINKSKSNETYNSSVGKGYNILSQPKGEYEVFVKCI